MDQKTLVPNLLTKVSLPETNTFSWRPRSEAELVSIPNGGHPRGEKKHIVFANILDTSATWSNLDVLRASARPLRPVLHVVPYKNTRYTSSKGTLCECRRTEG